MVAKVNMLIPLNRAFRRNRPIKPNSANTSNNSTPNTDKNTDKNTVRQEARAIRREMLKARFTMHNLYGVATSGCRSCGS